MASFDGKAMAADVSKSIRSYTDRRVGNLTKFISMLASDVATQRKMILDQREEIKELRFKLSIVDHRTARTTGKPVKLG